MDNREIEKEILEEKKSISHLRVFFLVFFLVAILVSIAFYYSTNKHEGRLAVDGTVFDARLQNVENAIPLHEKRITKLEEDLAKLSPSTAAPTNAASAESNEKIEAMEKEIKSLKLSTAPQDPEHISQAITLLSSFHRLSNNIMAGKPFSTELATFLSNYGTDADKSLSEILAPLTPYADSGVPNNARLIATFDDALASLRRSENTPPENAGFWEKFMFNLSHMISIRRVDKSQIGSSVDAILGRAEDDLNDEQTNAAVTEVKSLPDNVRSNFSAWLEDAQLSNLAPSIVDKIEEKVMKKAFSSAKK